MLGKPPAVAIDLNDNSWQFVRDPRYYRRKERGNNLRLLSNQLSGAPADRMEQGRLLIGSMGDFELPVPRTTQKRMSTALWHDISSGCSRVCMYRK